MKRTIALLIVCILACGPLALSEEQNEIWVKPGDSGGDVQIVLDMAHNLGFLKELPKYEDEYREDYIPAVQQLETALSLEADGIVRLYELDAIDGLIYPGKTGKDAERLLERLANLGYISSLPDQPTTYEQKYVGSVKKAEKQFSLTPDGYVTMAEWDVIYKQKVIRPETIKTLTVTAQGGKAVLKWSAAKNAVNYIIRRDGKEAASVKGTSWTDSDVQQGQSYSYTVTPVRYDITGTAKGGSVYIEPVYKSISAPELARNRYKYLNQYVNLSKTNESYSRTDGSDYKIALTTKADGRSYTIILVLKNYKSWIPEIARYNLTAAAAKGKVIYVNGGAITIEVDNVTYWH